MGIPPLSLSIDSSLSHSLSYIQSTSPGSFSGCTLVPRFWTILSLSQKMPEKKNVPPIQWYFEFWTSSRIHLLLLHFRVLKQLLHVIYPNFIAALIGRGMLESDYFILSRTRTLTFIFLHFPFFDFIIFITENLKHLQKQRIV